MLALHWTRTTTRYLAAPLRLLRDYRRADLRADLTAALTVGVILLPQSIAYTLLADLPPVMGLYVAITSTAVAALWGSSNHMSGGPTNTAALLTVSALAPLAAADSPRFILAAGLIAVMVGALQLAVGLTRLGVLVNFVSHSVIVGFTAGAGLQIAVKQLGPLLGVSIRGENLPAELLAAARALPDTHPVTAAIGLGVIAALIVLRRYRPRWPGALLALMAAGSVVALFSLQEQGVRTIGALPRSLPPLSPVTGYFDLELIRALSSSALAIAAVGLVETAAIARSLAAQTGQRLDINQEFIGRGLGNIAGGLFTGYPSSGSFTRSVVAWQTGARTRLAAVFSALFVLIALFPLAPLGAWLPSAALAGVLIITAWSMVDRAEMGRILRGARYDAVIMVATLLGTLFLDLQFAVLIGILLSFGFYIMQTSVPRVESVVPDESYLHFVPQNGRPACPQMAVISIFGDLYFGAVNSVEDTILDQLERAKEERFLLVRMHQVNQIDFSGIHMLETLLRSCRERGGQLFLARVQPQARALMDATGFTQRLGAANILDGDNAISHLFYHRLDPAVCIYECPVRVFKECQNLPKAAHLFHPEPPPPEPADLGWVTPQALWSELRDGRPLRVIDVRELGEYRRSHIAQAEQLPLGQILAGTDGLTDDRPLVLVCRSSRRSVRAAAVLHACGLRNLRVLEGGMNGWETANLLTAVATNWQNEEPEQAEASNGR